MSIHVHAHARIHCNGLLRARTIIPRNYGRCETRTDTCGILLGWAEIGPRYSTLQQVPRSHCRPPEDEAPHTVKEASARPRC